MAKTTMIKAITAAMDEELKRDDKVLVFGEDVGKNGGVFRATDGLQEIYGEDRVFDTPLAESGIGGLAAGLAFTGFRPVPEIQFFGFVFEVMDSIAPRVKKKMICNGRCINFRMMNMFLVFLFFLQSFLRCSFLSSFIFSHDLFLL